MAYASGCGMCGGIRNFGQYQQLLRYGKLATSYTLASTWLRVARSTWVGRWCLLSCPCLRQLSGQVMTRQEARKVLSRPLQAPSAARAALTGSAERLPLLLLAGKRPGWIGRDATVALPALCGHAPERRRQSSPQSNDVEGVKRCLTGEVYPPPDLAWRANERALRKKCQIPSDLVV
jgi:hypothetical protein